MTLGIEFLQLEITKFHLLEIYDIDLKLLVLLATGLHLIPFRTQQLSPSAAMVL